MGCGGSKLKGDAPDDVGTAPAQPARKVNSNFKDVDYNHGTDHKKSIAGDMAPHETNPPPKPTAAEQKDEDNIKLEPYKTIDESSPVATDPLGGSEQTPDMIR